MKNCFLATVFALLAFWQNSTGQNKISGFVKDKNNKPLSGVVINNKTKHLNTLTKSNGEFEIKADVKDVISVSFIGYSAIEFLVPENKTRFEIQLSDEQPDLSEVVVAGFSPKSYWLGAKLAYNIDGAEVDNVVGSAMIGINAVEGKYFGATWGIVGNFANFISAQNKEKTEKDLIKVEQSSQGLSIGFAGTWEFLPRSNDFNFRCYFTTGYRLNAFQKVGKDSINVSLSQFRNVAGVELEGFNFKNGGKLHFSFEGSLSFFDEKKYELVFAQKKSSLYSLEITAVLPIASNIGFLCNGTYGQGLRPVYQFGIIFKDLK